MIRRLFLDHPQSVDERYVEHAGFAARFGFAMISGGVACLLHAAVPALCERTGSDTVRRLHARIGVRRPRSTTGSGLDLMPTDGAQLIYEI